MRKIGFIGMGAMGAPMARNIHKAGFEVTVYNRTKERLQPLKEQGLIIGETLKETVQGKDVVITMLADDAAVKQVALGEGGIIDYIAPPTVMIDMSTVSPDTSLTLFEAMKQKHVTFIDAPVSGDSNAAKRASLVILAAGPKETVESLHELFSAMGKALYYFGENGNGSRAKLVINLMLGLTMQAIAEALVLAEKFSLDRGTILHMMQQTAVASPFLEFKKELLLKEEFPIAFALKHMQKDLGLILEQAQKTGGVLPATSAVFQTYTAARNHGMGDLDLSAVFQELLRQSGIEK